MKQAAFGIGAGLMMVFILTILMAGSSQSTRETELKKSLSMAMESTMEQVYLDADYEINSKEELVADFIEALLMQVDSDASIEVNPLCVDLEHGIFSVEVIETFRYSTGKEGRVSCVKTMVLDRPQD